MSSPIVFATEANRLKARAAHVFTMMADECNTLSERYHIEEFDAAFPPIAPPKMVPEEWWVLVNLNTRNRVGPLYGKTPIAMTGFRAARVRVEEVDA